MFFKTSPLFDKEEGLCLEENEIFRKELLMVADQLIGQKYDSKNLKGFDCSGFVQHCYKEIHINIPRSSRAQFQAGKKIPLEEVKLGDVLVFKGRNMQTEIAGHVAIAHHFQHDTLYFIHASSREGIVINHMKSSYYEPRYLGAVSFLE